MLRSTARYFSNHNHLRWMVLVLAFILRAWGINHGFSTHPDERHIIMTVTALSWNDLNPHSFAYGSLPFYLLFFLSKFCGLVSSYWTEYDGLYILGRWLSIIIGVTTVSLTMTMATALGLSPWGSLFAGALLACNVFHLQLSHFYTVDILLTLSCLAALLSMVRLIERPRFRTYARISFLLGASLAIKISALVLLAPLALSLFILWYRDEKRIVLRYPTYALGIIAGALITMIALAPYTLLDFPTFWKHTTEQIAMTQGRWRPPYTIQYVGTPAFSYPLLQMWRYLLSPPLAAVSLLGCIYLIGRSLFRRDIPAAALVVLSFCIALFSTVAPLEVKFPRYLLPLYPLLCWFAATLLELVFRARMVPRFIRYGAPVLTLLWALLYSLSFARTYSEPHVYEQASGWIYQNVPEGSRIIGVHWDDRLPITLPDNNPFAHRYLFEGPEHELPLYEPDSPQKIAALASTLSGAHYLVFPTARTYGSIPRLPKNYPNTLNLLSRLFRGELGFTLVQSFKVRPHLFGFVLNDDEADESFSVYDHPKVLIFKNEARLPAPELEALIRAQGPQLSQAELLSVNASDPLPSSLRHSSLEAALIWFLGFELISLCCLPLGARLFFSLPDRGYAVSKVLSFLLLGTISWAATWFLHVPTTSSLGWLSAGLLFSTGLVSWVKFSARPIGESLRYLQQSLAPSARIIEPIFIGVFFGWCIIRCYSPEIFWGEKPMDSTFLRFFTRLETLPPSDPWAAGNTMSYYYGGVFLLSLLHKMFGIDPSFGYNVSLASIAALLFTSGYGALLWLTNRARWAIFGSLLLLLSGTWELTRLSIGSWFPSLSLPQSFDLFWASSRLLTSPAITEYPIWSLLFGDLHAHVIALPFVVLFLALEVGALRGHHVPILRGISWGALFALNSWDFIGVSLVWALCLGTRCVMDPTNLRRTLQTEIYTALTAMIVVLPFAFSSVSTEHLSFGMVTDGWVTFPQVALHLGQFWLFSATGIIALLCTGWAPSPKQIVGALALGSLVLVPAGLALTLSLSGFSWPLVLVAAAGIVVQALFLLSSREDSGLRIAALFGIIALCLIIGVEYFYLIDRMNTIFKFYNLIWSLSALSAVTFLACGFRSLPRFSFRRGLALFFTGTNCLALLFGSVTAVCIMMNFRRTAVDRPTLDGIRYLELVNRDESALVHWINQNIPGTPTILEAHGDGYGPFTRVSMHTGLPTVLGWPHHVTQRGTSMTAVMERRWAVESIYRTPTLEVALDLLNRYHVQYIVVGELERQSYGSEGLKKFQSFTKNFEPMFRAGDVTLYRVVRAGQSGGELTNLF